MWSSECIRVPNGFPSFRCSKTTCPVRMMGFLNSTEAMMIGADGENMMEKKEISSTCPHLLLNTYTLSEHLDSINFFSSTVGNVWQIVVSSWFFLYTSSCCLLLHILDRLRFWLSYGCQTPSCLNTNTHWKKLQINTDMNHCWSKLNTERSSAQTFLLSGNNVNHSTT